MSNLLKTINREIEDFKSKQVQIVPGLSFNQYDTIQKIFFYYNSKFTSGDIDDEGDRKYFNNIVKNPCKVFSKAVDFDTKNIRMLTSSGGNPLKTWFMERDLKYWMRDIQFGKVLNRIFKELPIFGSVVLKIVDGKPYFVDLRNFVVEQSAEKIDDANHIIEIHNYTVPEFRKIAKKMKWEKEDIDDTIKMYHEMKETSHIKIYERYGEVYDEEKDSYSYRRLYIADVGVDEFDQYGNLSIAKPGVLLSSEEYTQEELEKVYWEFHSERMSGRWLGIGVVETLFEPQIRLNEIANLQSKTSYWAALRLFFSRDSNMAGNLKTEKRNGEVITGDSEITQVDMSDRNLAFFNQETDKWMGNRSELTFSYDVIQGERLPAGTPLGSAQLATQQTLSYFEGIQENIAMDVKEMIYKVIIPQWQKDSNKEHTIRLVGKDLDTYIGMVKGELVLKELIRSMVNFGKFPTNEEKDAVGLAVEESIKQEKEKIITVPKGHYEGVKYDIDIDITGESVDTRVKAAAKFAVIQAITADPTMITDPLKKKILMSYMEDGGINPNDFFDVEKKDMQDMVPNQPGRAGGGVSAPQLGGGALAGPANQTI